MARRGHCCRCSCSIEPVFADGPPQGFSPNAPLPEAAVAIAADLISAMPAVIDGTTPQTSALTLCADGIGCGTLSRVIVPPVPTETYNAGYQMVQADRGPGKTPRFVWERQNFTGTIPTTAIWTWPSNSWNVALNGQSRRTTRPELSLAVRRDDGQSLATAASFYKRAPAFLVPPFTPIDTLTSQSESPHAQKWFTKNGIEGFQSNVYEPARFYFPLEPRIRRAAIQNVDIYRLDQAGVTPYSVTNTNTESLNGTFLSSEISIATSEEGSYFVWVTMSPGTSWNFFYPVSFVVDRTPPLATLAQSRDWFADESGFANSAAPLSLTLEATEPCGVSGAIEVQPPSLAAGDHTRQLQGGPYRDRAGNNLVHTPSAAFTVHEKPDDDRYGAIAAFELPSAKTTLFQNGVTRLVLRFDRPVVGLTAENILIEKVVGPDWERTAIDSAAYEVTLGNSRQEWIVTIFEEQPPNSLWYATFKPIRDGEDAPNVFVAPSSIEHLTTPPTATNYGAVYWNADERKDYVFTGPGNLVEATPAALAEVPGYEVVDELPSQGNCRTVYEIEQTGERYLFLGGSYVTSALRDTSRPVTYQRTVSIGDAMPLVGHPDTAYFTLHGYRYWSDRGGTAANYAVDSIALRQLYGISEPCRLAARATWIVLPETGKNAEPADVRVSRIGTIGEVSSVSGIVDESLHADFIDADGDGENAPTKDVSVSSTNGLRPRFDSPYYPEYSSSSAAGFLPRVPPSATDPDDAVGRFGYWGIGTTLYPSPPALVDECAPPAEAQRHSSAIFSANEITSLDFSFRTTVEWANVAQVQAGINALVYNRPITFPCQCTLCGGEGKIVNCGEVLDEFGKPVWRCTSQTCPQCGGDGVATCTGTEPIAGGGGFNLNAYLAYIANPPLRSWSGVWPECGPSPYPAARDSYMANVFPGRTPPPYKIGEATLEPFTVNASPSEPQNTWTAPKISATAWRNFTEYLPLQTTVVDGLVLGASGRMPYDTTVVQCLGNPPDMGGAYVRIPVVRQDSNGNYFPDVFGDPFFSPTSTYLVKRGDIGPCQPPTYLRRNSEGGYDPFTPAFAAFPSSCQDQRGVNEVVYRRGPIPGNANYGFFEEHYIWLDSGTRGNEPVGRQDITRYRGFHTWAVEEQLTREQEETLASGGTVEWLEYQELRSPPALGWWAAPFDGPPYDAENMAFYNALDYAAANLKFAVNYYVSVKANFA